MVVFLNRHSNNGCGKRKWDSISSAVEERAARSGQPLIVDEPGPDPLPALREWISKGETVFAAAGGDGSVHALCNALMNLDKISRDQVVLGAIGLGSSNDFHKPYSDQRFIGDVPARIDFTDAVPHNIGAVEYVDAKGDVLREHFIINASFGVLAEGNDLFNRGDAVINWLKHRWVNGTITYAALKTMLTYKRYNAEL